MTTLTTRQAKILTRFWQWTNDRALDVQQNSHYCGYLPENQPASGVILRANWNDFRGATIRPFRGMPASRAVPRPRDWADILERIGVECEWQDEWAECESCDGIFRTEPDSYGWRPQGTYIESRRRYQSFYSGIEGTLCLDCLEEEARSEREDELNDAYERALPTH